MKVIITGASGMVGKGVLLECLDSELIDSVLSIGRSASGLEHSKLTELTHANFLDFSNLGDKLSGYDACYFCLGVSAGGMKEADYALVTHDFTLSLAKTLKELNDEMTFTYVSGQGTDSSEHGRTMWARVKGKTENDLMNLGFRQSFMFRPGAIIPLRGIKSKTKAYQFMYDYFMWLVKLIKFFAPKSVVNTTDIGISMINITRNGYPNQVINPKDIHILANQS